MGEVVVAMVKVNGLKLTDLAVDALDGSCLGMLN
jgi:hypothetical protein